MKQQKLTTDIIKSLKPSKILYAEFAEGGAMGAAGTARIYYLDGDKLSFYLVSTIPKESDEDLDTYSAAYKLLRRLSGKGKLTEAYAGFGNYAWKNPKCHFKRNDSKCIFIYDKHEIIPSCNGVYFAVAAKFGERRASTDALKKHYEKIKSSLSDAEALFYEVYIETCEEIDAKGHYTISIDDYWSALRYIDFVNKEYFNINNADLRDGFKAIQKYRLRYAAETCGWDKLDEFFSKYIQKTSPDLFEELKAYTEDNLGNGFETIIRRESDRTKLEPAIDNVAELFYYPFIVDFKQDTRETIINKILEMDPSSLRANSESIAYFFANFIYNEDIWPYTEVLPAAIHVIKNLPFDDDNNTDTPALFWLAGDIIDRAWRYIEENKTTQEKYQSLVYDTYWPRIGEIWPIVHYDTFEFKKEATTRMFNDTLGFVMSVKDIAKRNESIGDYFNFLIANNVHHPCESVASRVFALSLENKTSKEALETILETINPQFYDRFLHYPETTEDAKYLLEELFRTDDGARITGINRFAVIESLLLTPNSIGVGEYILKYLNDHFDDYVKILTTDSENEGVDINDVITTLFTAISSGASEENEFPYIKLLATKTKKFLSGDTSETNDDGKNGAKDTIKDTKDPSETNPLNNLYYINQIDYALKLARKHRRTILFQRSALQKLF